MNTSIKLLNDYTVIDIETTGHSFKYDEIIEIGAIKVRNNEIVDQYNQLICPSFVIDQFITDLTGITNEMLENQPNISEIKNDFLSFIGSDALLGHNIRHDLKFLEINLNEELLNERIDTLRFSRKIYPTLPHHRLSDMVSLLNLSKNEHRSLSDCAATKQLYDCIKEKIKIDGIDIELLFKRKSSHRKREYFDISTIIANTDEIGTDSYFYNKHCVFTGKLDKMLRKDAMQAVVNLGGILDKSVVKETNLLILGNNDYCTALKGEKSSKHKKAEKMRSEGKDIDIIDEDTFYELVKL